MTNTANTPNFGDELNNDAKLCESCRWVTPEDNGTVVAAFDDMFSAARAMKLASRCGLRNPTTKRTEHSGWIMTAHTR